MSFVKFKGDKLGNAYSGFDGKQHIQVGKGNCIEVSEVKAKQLTTDFPTDFEIIEGSKAISEQKSAREDELKESEKKNKESQDKIKKNEEEKEKTVNKKNEKTEIEDDPFVYDPENPAKRKRGRPKKEVK